MTRLPVFLVFVLALSVAGFAAQQEKFGGLGLAVAQLYTPETPDHQGPIVVLNVLPGTPAKAAGIEPGDVITHVDGDPVEGKEFRTIVLNMLRGEVGSSARLTVKRGSEGEKGQGRSVEVKRVEIKGSTGAAPGGSMHHYQINGKPVSYKEYQEFLQTLTGQEHWSCAETNDGGITSWEAKDAKGRRYEVRAVSGGDNTSTITLLDLGE
ncbi:MAG: PDZ domain-containing protein [candidate division FCPU426 bacterium]